MECVNLLGQGRPVSQIQLTTDRVAVSFLSNMNASIFLARVGLLDKYNWLPPGRLSPSYQIWNASTFLAKVGRLAKYHWLQPGSCLLSINMKCVNVLRQGMSVSPIQLATARVLSPFYQI
ncbi:hypothetical protein CEXT_497121 [Caerostris extrusa]|uniref:Uncharacterized protein n=1 Tax=Caerostris extrusa TaxID=172846 RepID=A0AAV4NCH5_CAEEX|nr:hypothetical protein CEXT_497121 [Caerostris extrusa]